MRLEPYKNYNTLSLLPQINITYEKNFDGDLHYLSFEIGWLKWGISLIIKDE